ARTPGGLDALAITLRETGVTWRYGDPDEANLRGTTRTLDQADGPVPLGPGLVSRAGWAVVDDSQSLVFDERGWLEPRGPGTGQDLYFFGYGRDYRACLRDFSRVAGPAPLLPRWALGNWWSRYWAYTQDELTALIQDFAAHQVPLSVCIVDMDWHITDTGNQSSGWTGYTWNRELFPDPAAFIAGLHERGLKTALNLHPASGIHPHEAAYPVMAERLGLDPASQEPVPFAIADPRFTRAYFELLHHPLEAQGVDFWWLDWQQGTRSALTGLDPLWWLNHLHFYDLARNGDRRPFIFSRWGGLGNHRYPIGFSGDTLVTWRSLAFQPYFTATAANVGYGWWSHDIGGHMRGLEDAELYTRWVQFGVWSPILRLHSTKNPYQERRPWGWDAETLRVARDAMQLRHALIPYLYTMSWRNAQESIPLVVPMYHEHPHDEAAYCCPNQYYFGSELVAAPFTAPRDPHTGLSRQVVWLPEGDWFGFFAGEYYPGDAWHACYGGLDEMPVFARAGAIVPLALGGDEVQNPARLTVHVFPGADNVFTLYEDDGETLAYQQGAAARTTLAQEWTGDRLRLTLAPVAGDRTIVPGHRTYTLVFRGIVQPDAVAVQVNGVAIDPAVAYDPATASLTVPDIALRADEELTVSLSTAADTLMDRRDRRLETGRKLLRAFKLEPNTRASLSERLPAIIEDVGQLADFWVYLHLAQVRALVEVLVGAGVARFDQAGGRDRSRDGGRDMVVLWNNWQHAAMRYVLSAAGPWNRVFHSEQGTVPRFMALDVGEQFAGQPWKLGVDHAGLATITLGPERGA
ncbi:MAG: DUF5110 domain-containing protein, partial [Chloroflexi bacterium]|nr:DUF5110 domain-containing protein [Chloroflexota bacterium]